jgi:8-hydroxy-5-deazaflavin:NADPH oxidoreductase
MERIAILGGTGPEGMGLGLRLAQAGLHVVLGSRRLERAGAAAKEAKRRLRRVGKEAEIGAAENAAATADADLVVLAFPFRGVADLAPPLRSALHGKVVIDVINPLERRGETFLPHRSAGRSAGELLAELLPASRVVSAFKNLSAQDLLDIERPLCSDVLVCAENDAARARVIELIGKIESLRGVDAGRLINARLLESVTALLLNLNHRHRAVTSIRILGLPESSE